MHSEHAELISALRAENYRLTERNAEIGALRSILDAQDELLKRAAKIMAEQQSHLDRLEMLLVEALKCP